MDQIKIGKFIASCRKEKGMTQAYLAEKLGISDRAVSKWETGKSLPDTGIMLELCELLNINVNELLSGEKIMTETTTMYLVVGIPVFQTGCHPLIA
jgi:transcriptional regulator with XRE-family HTH domain